MKNKSGQSNRDTTQLNQYIMQIASDHTETVEQLVKDVQKKFSVPEREIMEHVLYLQKEGKLVLREDKASPLGRVWYWTIIALTLATIIVAFIIPQHVFPVSYARYLLGFLYILFLPGYCLVKVLFPGKELDSAEGAALSVVMSLVLVALTGFFLNYTPWGITVTTFTLSLLVLTVSFATAALIREA